MKKKKKNNKKRFFLEKNDKAAFEYFNKRVLATWCLNTVMHLTIYIYGIV